MALMLCSCGLLVLMSYLFYENLSYYEELNIYRLLESLFDYWCIPFYSYPS